MDRTVGFIDVGTNSVHMLVVRFYEGTMGTPVYQDKEAVRLGYSLFIDGAVDEATIDKTDKVLASFAAIARSYGAEEILACATCAVRESPNADRFLQIAKRHGIKMEIIDGTEEARITRLGVLGPVSPRRTLLMDIGGGSTEITIADGDKDLMSASLKVGALRLTFGHGFSNNHRIEPEKYDFLRRCVDTEAAGIAGKVKEIGFETAVGSSGTLMTLAAACAARRGDGDDSYFTYTELESLMRSLCRLGTKQRAKMAKIGPSRADIIIGGGAAAEELMFLFGIDRMEISGNGLREGMRMDYLIKNGWETSDIRSSSVYSLAGRFSTDREHGENVKRLALELYGLFTKAGLVEERDVVRDLIAHAAVLAEVGAVAGRRNKGDLTSLIIRRSALTGFEPDELDTLALLATLCRGPIPPLGSKTYSSYTPQMGTTIAKCAMILKLADIADRGRDGAVESLTLSNHPDCLTIGLVARSDVSLALWKMESVSDEFRRIFGRNLRVAVRPNNQ